MDEISTTIYPFKKKKKRNERINHTHPNQQSSRAFFTKSSGKKKGRERMNKAIVRNVVY